MEPFWPRSAPLIRFFITLALMVVFVVCGLPSSPARSQPIPKPAEPGQIEKQFKAPVTPKSVLEPVIPEFDGKEAPPEQAGKITFVLSGITVGGSTVYQPADFEPLYKQYLGRHVSLLQIYEIARAITAKYRNNGYILSRAIVPPQKIRNGIVHIKIIEGYINKIIIEGGRRDSRNLFERFGEKITQSIPLQIKILERYLLLADDLPGTAVQSVLRPAQNEQGASELVISVTQKMVQGSLGLDNRGSKYIGPVQLATLIDLNSLFTLSEKSRFRYIATPEDSEELRYFDFLHEEMLDAEGTKITLQASRVLSEPGYSLDPLEVKGASTTFAAAVSRPFIRSRAKNFGLYCNFSYRESKNDMLDSKLFEDRLRVVRLGGSYDFVDSFKGINLIALEISKGLNIFNNTDRTDDQSRANGRSDFFKSTADLFRLQRLSSHCNLLIAATGQYAPHSLLSSEEFSLGGAQFGRGYDQSEINGDYGAAGKLELQYSGSPDLPYLKAWQFYGFYDGGAVWEDIDHERQSLTSAGIGVRFNLTDWMSGYVELAKPLTLPVAAEEPGDGNDSRFFFNLTARF
ncbi:MAG: hypothetical protein MUO63_08310 [Desulfobulbaceae bacterium]|nr:hypothetical protein [Desulfobulbaceae bacterium]